MGDWDIVDQSPAAAPPEGGDPWRVMDTSPDRLSTALSGRVDPSEFERQAFAGVVKGVAGLPGVPGYLLNAAGRATDWAARKMMTPEQYEAYQRDLERRGMSGHETMLPMPETFIKPVEKYVTGPLAEPKEQWQRYVQAAGAGAPFGPAATLASLAGEAASHAFRGTDYEEVAGLGAGMIAPRAAGSVGSSSRAIGIGARAI